MLRLVSSQDEWEKYEENRRRGSRCESRAKYSGATVQYCKSKGLLGDEHWLRCQDLRDLLEGRCDDSEGSARKMLVELLRPAI